MLMSFSAVLAAVFIITAAAAPIPIKSGDIAFSLQEQADKLLPPSLEHASETQGPALLTNETAYLVHRLVTRGSSSFDDFAKLLIEGTTSFAGYDNPKQLAQAPTLSEQQVAASAGITSRRPNQLLDGSADKPPLPPKPRTAATPKSKMRPPAVPSVPIDSARPSTSSAASKHKLKILDELPSTSNDRIISFDKEHTSSSEVVLSDGRPSVPGVTKPKAPFASSLHSLDSQRVLQQLADRAGPVLTVRPVEVEAEGSTIRRLRKLGGLKYSEMLSTSKASHGSSSAVQPAQLAAPTKMMTHKEADRERKAAGKALKKAPKSIVAQQNYEQALINKMWAYHNDPEARAKQKAESKARRDGKMETVKAREDFLAKVRLQRERWFESLGGKEVEREYVRMSVKRSRDQKKAREDGDGL